MRTSMEETGTAAHGLPVNKGGCALEILLLIGGLILYSTYGLPGFCCLLAVTLVSYGCAMAAPGRRCTVWLCVGLVTGMLVIVKLQPLTGWSLFATMGISYYTLRILSYQLDVARGKYPPERSLVRYALYVTYFPAIFSGPIQRYDQFRDALPGLGITWEGVSAGAIRLLWGMLKKLVIANRAGVVIAAICGDTQNCSGGYALLAMVLYALQLYADFSGAMDLVLGGSRMLGLALPENFNRPYFSQTVSEFWQRWHITLGAWLRDYIYIPLGGSRKGNVRRWCNVLLVFLISGLWHGIHYVLWGLCHGMLAAARDGLKTPWKRLNQAITFCLVTLLWAFFVWPDTATALRMLLSVFTQWNYPQMSILSLGLDAGEWIVLAASAVLLWACDWQISGVRKWLNSSGPVMRVAVVCTLGLLVLLFGQYGIGFQAEAFLYSRF